LPQYAAVHQGHVLAANPEYCLDVELRQAPLLAPTFIPIGDLTPLNHLTDPLVRDCLNLFNEELEQECNRTYDVKILSATVQVIAGIRVGMYVKIEQKNGTVIYHYPRCDFEFPKGKNSSRLQPSLHLNRDLCLVGIINGSADVGATLNQKSFGGYLPKYTGTNI
jgi:hypothetical protein